MALQVASIGKTYTLSITPNGSYPDTDSLELTNEVLGNGADYTDLGWVGFQDLPAALDVTVDLGSLKGNIQQFRSYFLQDTPNGIHRPDTVEILTSTDGAAYTSRGTTAMAAATNDTGSRWVYVLSITGVTARYLRWRITRQAGLEWVFIAEVEAYRDVYSDTFDRASSNALGLLWVEVESDAAAFRLSAAFPNLVEIVNGGAVDLRRGFAYWNDAVDDAQFSELTWVSQNAADGRVGPAVRIDSAGTVASFTGYGAVVPNGAATILLRKYVAEALNSSATGTTLGTFAHTMVNGDVLLLEAIGARLYVLLNGVAVIIVDDADILTGKVGMMNAYSGSPGSNAIRWNNWRGGDVTLLSVEAPRIYGEHYLRNNILEEFPRIFAEGFLRGFDYIPPVESKRIMGEHYLKGIVDPELGYIRADHFLKGKDALTGPPPTRITYVTRGSKRRITWET